MLSAPFYELDGQIAVDLPGARAVFTTSAWGDLRETWLEVAERLTVRIVKARQVHGATVITVVEGRDSLSLDADADGIATANEGLAPTVLAADCVPIVVAAPGAVATLHAGWRGLEAGVIANGVGALRALVGDAQLTAAIGPAAGACCYEVGTELHERFPDFCAGSNLDLNAIARAELVEAGVTTIHDTGICTICSNPALFYSYRRDGPSAGRQGAIAWLT
jgi:purine-nucleoside/S-methyl-5'-thioadenosine phosphorylase / adenosine deaminase